MKYDVASAKKHAADGQIEAWVDAYLAEGDWANAGLSEGLKLQTRYWVGPIEMALDDLVRTCGPEPNMPFQVDAAGWELKVTLLAGSIQDPADLPPVIAEYLQGILYIRDGNHRHEALRRYRANRCWVLIWYNSEKDWREHIVANEKVDTEE
jgi:hypothetical protein